MKFIFYCLVYVYGIAMGGSSIALFKENTISLWLTIFNILGSLLLFLTPLSKIFLYSGLLLLIIVAIVNGFILNGFPNWKHLLVRFILSISIIFLYHYFKM
ncbi:hypothetical protein CJ755_003096 [Listeria monocytogenes]|nr:hypothetical protein [Listeria monocytogenes]